jgi:hypothetical protein
VSESVAAGDSVGFYNQSAGTLAVFHSVATNNSVGVASFETTISLAQSMVTGNATGWAAQSGGLVQSYGDNYFSNNGTNQGSLTLISKQ